MRILCLSNLYPPASQGGYEQWCQEVTNELRARNHEVLVLTSRHGRETIVSPDPTWLHRDLYLEMDFVAVRNGIQFFTERKRRENKNLVMLQRYVRDFQPDIVLIWGMWNLPRSLPALAEKLCPGRVVYYMGDYWPTLPSQYEFYWRAPARSWMSALPKAVLGAIARWLISWEKQPVLEFRHVIFPSMFLQKEFERKSVPVKSASVVYGAINTAPYLLEQRAQDTSVPQMVSLLYVGRLTFDKGVHTAIEALAQLVYQHQLSTLRLRIVGTGDKAYVDFLHRLVQQKHVEQYVQFCGPQPKEALPRLYRESDLFLFTSIWQEPFGRVLIEAMASGTVVVGATSGGAAEILRDNENALTFSAGDAGALAAQIARLVSSPDLRQKLASEGRKTAQKEFDIQRMTAEIEIYLQQVIATP